MKCTSVQFVFDNGATVTFVRGSKEVYTGQQEQFMGKPYTYTVIIENKNGRHVMNTFSSPSQDMAKTFLQKSLNEN
jgi:hypothetical protein